MIVAVLLYWAIKSLTLMKLETRHFKVPYSKKISKWWLELYVCKKRKTFFQWVQKKRETPAFIFQQDMLVCLSVTLILEKTRKYSMSLDRLGKKIEGVKKCYCLSKRIIRVEFFPTIPNQRRRIITTNVFCWNINFVAAIAFAMRCFLQFLEVS